MNSVSKLRGGGRIGIEKSLRMEKDGDLKDWPCWVRMSRSLPFSGCLGESVIQLEGTQTSSYLDPSKASLFYGFLRPTANKRHKALPLSNSSWSCHVLILQLLRQETPPHSLISTAKEFLVNFRIFCFTHFYF